MKYTKFDRAMQYPLPDSMKPAEMSEWEWTVYGRWPYRDNFPRRGRKTLPHSTDWRDHHE